MSDDWIERQLSSAEAQSATAAERKEYRLFCDAQERRGAEEGATWSGVSFPVWLKDWRHHKSADYLAEWEATSALGAWHSPALRALGAEIAKRIVECLRRYGHLPAGPQDSGPLCK